jgi:hypothetical protein
MKVDRFFLVRVRTIPPHLKEGYLYVSRKYQTSCHLCPCGCGYKVVTPLGKGFWRIKIKFFRATLYPSIGNWTQPCKSHYWIQNNKVIWAAPLTETDIDKSREQDFKELLHLYRH